MRGRGRFQIVTTTCRRCGKPLATGNHSLFGANRLKAQYDRICEGCMSPEEKAELLARLAGHVGRTLGK